MFKVFISSRALSDIYLKESMRTNKRNQSNWFRILLKQNALYTIGTQIPCEIPEDDDTSDGAILWHLCENENIELTPCDEYLGQIVNQPQLVLEQPCGVFYLDISPKDARRIQKEYGVICQSIDKPFDAKVLAAESEVYDFPKYRDAPQWKAIFEIPNKAPSNAICIVDRNLFAYDGQKNGTTGKEQTSGLYNVFFILDAALPKSLLTAYHVTIICEYMSSKEKKTNRELRSAQEQFKTISNTIFEEIKLLKRPFPIEVEVIAFKKLTRFYNEVTHNRQILSNYYRIAAENGLNATNYDMQQKSTYSQQINAHLLYSTGLRHAGTHSTADTNNRMFNDCFEFIQHWRNNSPTEDYFYATNIENGSFMTHRNRLFQKM